MEGREGGEMRKGEEELMERWKEEDMKARGRDGNHRREGWKRERVEGRR